MRLLLIYFGISIGITQQVFSQTIDRPGQDYALFIYVSDFKEAWNDLPSVPKEVKAINDELVINYGFKTEILPNPSTQEVINKLKEYQNAQKFKNKDQFLVFISTHGYKSSQYPGGLVFQDSKFEATDLESLLAYSELKRLLEAIPCNHMLLALDACYSGVFADEFKNGPGPPDWQQEITCETRVNEALRGKTYLYFTSVGKNDRSPSESAFALRFLNRLQEQDDDGIISYYELYAKLLGNVRPKPHSGEFTNIHQKGSDFVFIRKNVCTEESKKGTISTFVPPPLKPANLSDPPTLSTNFINPTRGDISSMAPRIEGGIAGFGYTEGATPTEPEHFTGGKEDIFFLLTDRFHKEEKVCFYGQKGNERALHGIQCFDGGYVMVGFTDSPGENQMGKKDCYIIKINNQGKLEWQRRRGSKEDDQYNHCLQMENGTIIAAGQKGDKPVITLFSITGEVIKEFNQLPIRGTFGNIKRIARTPFDDLLLLGNAAQPKSSSPFLMRFDLNIEERVGDAYYIESPNKKLSAIDLEWTSLNQIVVLCQERNESNQDKFSLHYFEDKNNAIVSVKSPSIFGGDASDFANDMCSDLFGNVYITGMGKSYKNKGGLFERLFVIEVDREGKQTGSSGWQGSFKGSHGNAIAFLPGRRLVVGGQDHPESVWIQHFNLGLVKNDDPRLFFDDQASSLFESNFPDGKLSENEQGWYLLRIENKSEYITGGVIKTDIQSNESWVTFPKNLYLPDIPPLSGITVALPIRAVSNIPSGSKTALKMGLNVSGKDIGAPIVAFFNH